MAASTTMKTWTWRMRKNASALSYDTQHRAYRRILFGNATLHRCSASRRHRDPAVDLAKKPAPPPGEVGWRRTEDCSKPHKTFFQDATTRAISILPCTDRWWCSDARQ